MADKKSPASGWPLVKGDFHSGDANSPVAVVTMGSHLDEQGICDAGAALCGSCKTENLGLEKVIANVIANPNIRFILFCGTEVKGHLSGQTSVHSTRAGSKTAGSSVLKVLFPSSKTSMMHISSASRNRLKSSTSWRAKISALSRRRSTNSRARTRVRSVLKPCCRRGQGSCRWTGSWRRKCKPAVPRDREETRQDREEDRVRGCRGCAACWTKDRTGYRHTVRPRSRRYSYL
jgi:hypothetical protein